MKLITYYIITFEELASNPDIEEFTKRETLKNLDTTEPPKEVVLYRYINLETGKLESSKEAIYRDTHKFHSKLVNLYVEL